MDNDNKIKNKMSNMNLPVELIDDAQIKKDIDLFLPEEMRPARVQKPSTYDIETEYAKTKKNKSHYILWLMLATIFVAVLVTFCVSKYVEHMNNSIAVNIDVFDDLNLRNLLDTASQTQASYDAAVKEKSELSASMQYELSLAEQRRDTDLHTLTSLRLDSKKEINRRTAEIHSAYDEEIKAVHEKYDVKISTQESLIAQYKEQLDQYDNSKIEQAQIIDSTKQLYEIEKSQMKESHEKEITALRTQIQDEQKAAVERQMKAVTEVTQKYQKEIDGLDPVIKGKDLIVEKAKRLEGNSTYVPDQFTKELTTQASSDYVASLKKAAEGYGNFNDAKKIVAAIPQKHSIPSFVNAMSQYAYNVGTVLTNASVTEVNRFAVIVDNCKLQIADLNVEIAGYKSDIANLHVEIDGYKNDIAQLNVSLEESKKETANVKQMLDDTQRTVRNLKDEKAAVEKDRSNLFTYLETICIENKRDGLLLALPVNGKAQIYLSNAARDYFVNPMYEGMTVYAQIKRGKNSKVTTCTVIAQAGNYYCVLDDAAAVSKLKSEDWIGVTSVALPDDKK